MQRKFEIGAYVLTSHALEFLKFIRGAEKYQLNKVLNFLSSADPKPKHEYRFCTHSRTECVPMFKRFVSG